MDFCNCQQHKRESEENEDFKTANALPSFIKLTSDYANWRIELMQKFPGLRTKDEEQLVYVMQIVAENKKRLPKALKQTLKGQ